MFLITTADKRFWKTNEPILFLGEWCKLFSHRSVWEKLSYDVLPYHWDNRNKLFQDYLYLDNLYEQILLQMTDILNQIHGMNYSVRYWRIVIGPWLYWFIQILYDRYQSILTAMESGRVTNTLISRYDAARELPKDFPSFIERFANDDYNHYLYSRIIELTGKIPFQIIELNEAGRYEERSDVIKDSSFYEIIFKKLIGIYGKFLPKRFNNIILISSYLNAIDLMLIQLSLRQIPYLFPPDVATPDVVIDLNIRRKLFIRSPKNEFEKLLDSMIKEQIPLIYVEGYAQMNECSLKAYPKNPKIIFTANAYNSNEAFKFWAGQQVVRGVKFVGTQHGGHYGIGRWFSEESHEIKIYDMYYTWGWKSDVYNNVKPLAAAKLNKVKKFVHQKNDGKIFMISCTLPRYSYHMFSGPVAAPGILSYFSDQYRFVRALSTANQKLLLIRLFHVDYRWNQKDRWKRHFPKIECYQGSKSIFGQLRESRLALCTYNSTTYLETFSANFPTVMFWNPNHWELNKSAQPYFDELRRVGIFHETPESAAALVNEIAHDPGSWWNQTGIQRAKDQFCLKYARTSDSWLREWKKEFLDLSKTV